MCGICGFINSDLKKETAESTIKAMCDVILHRGPDEAGYYSKQNVTLGMRRLKIIDLSTGSQPIYNEDKTVVVVFNGEIYNFLELKTNLEAKGHQFYTNTDTEVIVHLYEEHGGDFLKYLNGMFGISLWDEKEKKLIIARDRLGEKPLYYSTQKGTFLFGSEIKSLLCYPGFPKEINPKAVLHYFTFNYIPAPLTIYKNVFKLFPGECLICHNGEYKLKTYWQASYSDQNPVPVPEKELEERLVQEVYDSVKLRLTSDVPLGAFLSGGIDSSIMVALMSQINNSPIKTFSIGLANQKKSELPFARAVADQYETEHHELIAKPDALSIFNNLVWHFDEPFGDSSAIPTFLVSQLTKQYVTVAISGDGGDELFGGYKRYQRILQRASLEKLPKTLRHILGKGLGDQLPFGFKGKAFLQSMEYNDYDSFAVGTRNNIKQNIFSDSYKKNIEGMTSFEVSDNFLLHDQLLLNQCMFFDLKVYLPDDILVKVDRMSMANSLETRAPFLDHNLVEFAMTIPPHLKTTQTSTKDILKKAFRKQLPEVIFSHEKTGFSIPLGDWFRNDLKSFLMDSLTKERIEDVGFLNYPFVRKIISQHMTGQRNHDRLLWMILMFQEWHSSWFKNTHPKMNEILQANNLT